MQRRYSVAHNVSFTLTRLKWIKGCWSLNAVYHQASSKYQVSESHRRWTRTFPHNITNQSKPSYSLHAARRLNFFEFGWLVRRHQKCFLQLEVQKAVDSNSHPLERLTHLSSHTFSRRSLEVQPMSAVRYESDAPAEPVLKHVQTRVRDYVALYLSFRFPSDDEFWRWWSPFFSSLCCWALSDPCLWRCLEKLHTGGQRIREFVDSTPKVSMIRDRTLLQKNSLFPSPKKQLPSQLLHQYTTNRSQPPM